MYPGNSHGNPPKKKYLPNSTKIRMKGANKRRLFDLLIITLFNNRIGRKKNMMQPIDNIKNNKIDPKRLTFP